MVHQAFEFWITSVQYVMDTWCRQAYTMFVSSMDEARKEHEKWVDMTPEEQAGMERTYVLGSVNPVPQAPDTVTAHMRVDLLEAVPKFLRDKMTRSGTHQVKSILLYIMKTLLPSTEYCRIGVVRDITKHPRNGNPRDLYQTIVWLEDFFNRFVVAVSVKAMIEPKEVLAFVHGIVRLCYANDVEMNMAWTELKNKFEVTLKSFDNAKLDGLLRELIVKLRMRRNNARFDTALGVS
eukprot:2616874-Amphidinium_carterae.1